MCQWPGESVQSGIPASQILRILARARSPAKNTTYTVFSTFSPVLGSSTQGQLDHARHVKDVHLSRAEIAIHNARPVR